ALAAACVTSASNDAARPVAEPSFSVAVSALPTGCCPVCSSIDLSVRNTTDNPLLIDWERSRFLYNSDDIRPVLAGGLARTRVAPHSTLTMTMLPPAGAPNVASLREGKFRNGKYRMALAVLDGAQQQLEVARTEVVVSYVDDDAEGSSEVESA